jgi:transcriptional regulator GlxA family with amidase domain
MCQLAPMPLEADAVAIFVRGCQLLAGLCVLPDDAAEIACAAWRALAAWPDVTSMDVARRMIYAVVRLAECTIQAETRIEPLTTNRWRPDGRLRAAEAVSLIFAHHREPDVSLQAIADRMLVSRWHLCELLKRVSGYGFADHVAGFRLLSSVTLLARTTYDIAAVAHACGYMHPGCLDRHFRERLRMTPTRFRRLCAAERICTARNSPQRNYC